MLLVMLTLVFMAGIGLGFGTAMLFWKPAPSPIVFEEVDEPICDFASTRFVVAIGVDEGAKARDLYTSAVGAKVWLFDRGECRGER